jgi:predicted nuclease with RNAse H fold
LKSRAASFSFSTPVLGLDLAGVSGRRTGGCLLKGRSAGTCVLHTDREILDFCRAARPVLVVMDAPLHLPPGRRSIKDRNGKHLRGCDEELLRRHIPFFPITLGPMRMLTVRGMRLKKRIEAMGIRIVEIYPGGAQDVWGIPRAKKDMAGLLRGLRRLGLLGLSSTATADELDAASGALVGQLYLRGRAEVLGDFKTGAIILPGAKGKMPRRGSGAARSEFSKHRDES